MAYSETITDEQYVRHIEELQRFTAVDPALVVDEPSFFNSAWQVGPALKTLVLCNSNEADGTDSLAFVKDLPDDQEIYASADLILLRYQIIHLAHYPKFHEGDTRLPRAINAVRIPVNMNNSTRPCLAFTTDQHQRTVYPLETGTATDFRHYTQDLQNLVGKVLSVVPPTLPLTDLWKKQNP